MPRFDISKIKSSGRPKGSKNKSYLTLEFWYNELMKDWDKLRPAQRAKLSKELMQMLTNKIKQLPGSVDDSVSNAEDAMNLLKEIEGVKAKDKQIDATESFVDPSTLNPPI